MERSSPVYDNKKGCCTSIKKVAVYQVCYLSFCFERKKVLNTLNLDSKILVQYYNEKVIRAVARQSQKVICDPELIMKLATSRKGERAFTDFIFKI